MHRSYLLIPLLLLGLGCTQATDTTQDQTMTEQPASTDTAETEKATELPMGTPENELDVVENPLSDHSAFLATSRDASSWDLADEAYANYASVPDILMLQKNIGPFPAGTLLSFFVDGAQDSDFGDSAFSMVYSLDQGKTWSDRVTIEIDGTVKNVIVADPSLVQLDDGRLRLYYFDFQANRVPPEKRAGQTYNMYAAISEDGLTFTQEALVYESPDMATDPDVIFWNDAWYLFTAHLADNAVSMSVSDDPLSFPVGEAISAQGVPGALAIGDELRIYGCTPSGGITAWSTDDGSNFKSLGSTGLEGCGPTITQLLDGSYLMALRLSPEGTGMDLSPLGQGSAEQP